jgi:hypothetical protein
VLSQTKEETCETTCDGVLYQWTMFQLSPGAKEAKVTTCTFVCRSPEQGLPVCPGGRCKDDQCTTCLPRTFTERAMDEFYSGKTGKADEVGEAGTRASNLPALIGIGVGTALLLGTGAALAVMWRRRTLPARRDVMDLSNKL